MVAEHDSVWHKGVHAGLTVGSELCIFNSASIISNF